MAAVKDPALALDKAKEASKKERALTRHRETNGLAEHINTELGYAVALHLAATYHQNDMHDEALQAYQVIVRNKLQFPQGGWLRVNMGNIYYQQQKYSQAIKMYRMALDQLLNTNKEVSGCAWQSVWYYYAACKKE